MTPEEKFVQAKISSILHELEELLNLLFGNELGYRVCTPVGTRKTSVYGSLGTAARYVSIAKQGFDDGIQPVIAQEEETAK